MLAQFITGSGIVAVPVIQAVGMGGLKKFAIQFEALAHLVAYHDSSLPL